MRVGVDVGKETLLAVIRWLDGTFERPWLVNNPLEIRDFVGLLRKIAQGRELRVALEPTGTYGDALRQALFDAGLRVERVSPKVAHDYAEVFDGVPSQFDGKDAAVVAELSALGKSAEWKYAEPSDLDQALALEVDWWDAQRRQGTMWQGRLEALLARHWPEATGWLKLSSLTLLRILETYGGPQGLADDPQAAKRVAGWGRHYLAAEKIHGLLASAGRRWAFGNGPWICGGCSSTRRPPGRRGGKSSRLGGGWRSWPGKSDLQAQAGVVGVATACVLWVYLGDPRGYFCAAAYVKAMGLNLTEYSSGKYQGQLRISNRGASPVRRWMYLAALRWISRGPVKRWYLRKRRRDEKAAKRAVTGVMRKLAKGLHRVGRPGRRSSRGCCLPDDRRRAASRRGTRHDYVSLRSHVERDLSGHLP